MNTKQCFIEGIILIEIDVFSDSRGMFMETYQPRRYDICNSEFIQDNYSRSKNHVIRGMHYQHIRPQSQLVTVLRGEIFDVCVDMRKNSTTFGKWYGTKLGECGPQQIYMAPGIAHGFCVLSDVADLHYKVSQAYDPADEYRMLWNDPEIGIEWPISNPLLSDKDKKARSFMEITSIGLFPNI